MKKVLVSMVVMMSLCSVSVFAADKSVREVMASSQSTQDEYTKIEVTEVPDVVKKGVEKAYAGQTIKEASVAQKEEAKTYKLVLTSTEGLESTVVFNDKGEEVK